MSDPALSTNVGHRSNGVRDPQEVRHITALWSETSSAFSNQTRFVKFE
jgi:hypothetical protein